MRETGHTGFFPYTPATNLLYGLREALAMLLDEEGLPAVFRRHSRHAEATRRAVAGWGLEVLCADPREYSSSLTAVVVPDGHDADRVREIILDGFDMSLGTGLGKLKGKIFRIGHLGHFNDLMLCGTLCGVEMGLHRAGIPHRAGGVAAALEFLGSALSDLVPRRNIVRRSPSRWTTMSSDHIEEAARLLCAARHGSWSRIAAELLAASDPVAIACYDPVARAVHWLVAALAADRRRARLGDPGSAARNRVARSGAAAASLGRAVDPGADAVSRAVGGSAIRRRRCRRAFRGSRR